ncbi:MAG: hypothetical protein H6Q17_568 [Bacteroidetes bacterium]|nr:hypothetical protein [Bacteroidota bacterium]
MSWQDRLNNIAFSITMGKGKMARGRERAKPMTFYPKLIVNYQENVEYNGTEYDFVGIPGSLFLRKLPKGRSIPLEFAFVGKDNDKEANGFEYQAAIPAEWTVTHPFYGKFHCQPLSLSMDNSGLDSTVIKITVIETNFNATSKSSNFPKAQTRLKENIELISARSLAVGASTPMNAKELEQATSMTKKIGTLSEAVLKTSSELKTYKSFLSNALNAIDGATALTTGYLTYIRSLINLPATVSGDIKSRINCIEGIFSSLVSDVSGTVKLSYFQKLFFNLLGVNCISAISTALQTQNTGDLQTRVEITFYLNKLKSDYATFLSTLYSTETTSFTPDHDLMFDLNSTVQLTQFYLYSVLMSAKQERTYYPSSDTNLLLLAHRLYGSASEDNMSQIKSTNKIGLSEILNIKKGRKIIYYV